MTLLAVIGAGSMGAQIAPQAALNGVDVMLQDKSDEQLRKAADSNRGHVMRRVEFAVHRLPTTRSNAPWPWRVRWAAHRY